MGLFNLGKKIDKGLELADQAIVDKDKLNDLKYTLEQARTELMLSGKGASITKVTICGLVIIIVLIGAYKFLFDPVSMNNYKDFVLSVTPLIGILIGAYGAGATLKKFVEK